MLTLSQIIDFPLSQKQTTLDFPNFFIRKGIKLRQLKHKKLDYSQDQTRIAFGSSLERPKRKQETLPQIFYDKQYSSVDKYCGAPIIPHNRNVKSQSEYIQEMKKQIDKSKNQIRNKEQIQGYTESVKRNKFKLQLKDLLDIDQSSSYFEIRDMPMTQKELQDSLRMLLGKHQANL